MALTLEIESVDKTSLFQVGSLSIQDDLNSRNTCGFVLFDQTGAYRPEAGQDVLIQHDGVTVFGGTIDTIRESQPNGTDGLEYAISCVDYNQIADRHLVARVYENKTLGYIAADIVTQDLAGEGVTVVHVQTGPDIVKLVCNYQTAAEVFNALAELTGYAWNLDYTKDLHFFARETYTAPIAITDADWNCRDLVVTRTRDQYRNRQYVRAGQDVTDSRIETFIGDGERKTFNLSFPVAKVPSLITVNAVSKTIGIRGLDTGKDWYWSKGEKEISQDDGAAALTSAQTLAVTYQGMFPILLLAQDDAEITDRIAVEGGSGIYDAIEDDQNIDNQDLATQKADALLRRFGNIPRIVEFETDEDGLASGQLITITLTAHGLAGDYLIDSVSASDEETFLRYRVRALDGESLGGWQEFFRKLAAAGRKFVIRENEVLILLRRTADTVSLTDAASYTSTGRLAIATSYGLFARASTAYDRVDGHSHAANVARYETGPWAGYAAVLAEEGTASLANAQTFLDTDGNSDGIANGYIAYVTDAATGTRSMDAVIKTFGRAASQKLVRTGGAAANRWGIKSSAFVAGVVQPSINSFLINVTALDAGAKVRLHTDYYDAANAWLESKWLEITAPTDGFIKYSSVYTTNPLAVKFCAFVWIYNGNGTAYIQAIQPENKAYATTWHNGTRAAESLAVPMAGMSPTAGTWEQWVYIPSTVQAASNARVMQMPGTACDGIIVWRVSGNYWLRTYQDDSQYTEIQLSAPTAGWRLVKAAWTSGVMAKAYWDNTLAGTITNPKLPSAFAASGGIGCKPDGTLQLNTLHACVRMSSTDRSAETPSLTIPLPLDDNTIYLLPLNGDLYYEPSADVGFCEVV